MLPNKNNVCDELLEKIIGGSSDLTSANNKKQNESKESSAFNTQNSKWQNRAWYRCRYSIRGHSS